MKTPQPHHALLRTALRANPRGLTAPALAKLTGLRDHRACWQVLADMPDAYIFDWKTGGKSPAAIWKVVVPPANAEKPKPLSGRIVDYLKTMPGGASIYTLVEDMDLASAKYALTNIRGLLETGQVCFRLGRVMDEDGDCRQGRIYYVKPE